MNASAKFSKGFWKPPDLRGIRRRVRRADGPERIFGEWWKRDAELAAVRDYFRIHDEAGERFWIYRAGDGEDSKTGSQRWFLHGMFGYRQRFGLVPRP